VKNIRGFRGVTVAVVGAVAVMLVTAVGATAVQVFSSGQDAHSLEFAPAIGATEDASHEKEKDVDSGDKDPDATPSASPLPSKKEDTSDSAADKASDTKQESDKEKDSTEQPACESEDREYKHRSPETNCEWKIKDGWYWDRFSDSYEQCVDGAGPARDFGYYSCVKNDWVPATGWVKLYDYFAPCVLWTDAATGNTFHGGLIEFDGWKKMTACNPSEGTYGSKYRVIHKSGTAFASTSGSTCTGIVENVKGAPHQWSCNPHTWGAHGTGEWVLASDGYAWFSAKKKYFSTDTPVYVGDSVYEWNGSTWVDVTPVDDPEPSPSATADDK